MTTVTKVPHALIDEVTGSEWRSDNQNRAAHRLMFGLSKQMTTGLYIKNEHSTLMSTLTDQRKRKKGRKSYF